MSKENGYSVLFEPVRIGPVTAKNRFYQVPHCCGFGHLRPRGHALSPVLNQRGDECGGSLENRVRLTRELLEDAQDVVAGRCAIALRLAVDDVMGADGMQAQEEGRAIVEMLSHLPDLWDVNVAGWDNDSQTARFAPDEGYQEQYTSFVKQVTDKPVVGVGHYTSPDRSA